jgi:hypothetical protein
MMGQKHARRGRPPKGEAINMRGRPTTVRLTQETRHALEREKASTGWSIEQIVERRLSQSLKRPDHVAAICDAIAMLIRCVERTTDAQWIDDVFTAEAARAAIDFLLRHHGPKGSRRVPSAIDEISARLPTGYAQRYRDPAEVGIVEAGRLIAEIESRGDVEGVNPLSVNIPGRLPYRPPKWGTQRRILDGLRPGSETRPGSAQRAKKK